MFTFERFAEKLAFFFLLIWWICTNSIISDDSQYNLPISLRPFSNSPLVQVYIGGAKKKWLTLERQGQYRFERYLVCEIFIA